MLFGPVISGSGLHALELAVVQGGVKAALSQQLVVIALLHDVAVFHHKDDIGLADGGEAVGHDEAGAAPHHPGKGGLDAHLGTGINGAGGLVQDQDGRVCNGCTGNGEKLSLALT